MIELHEKQTKSFNLTIFNFLNSSYFLFSLVTTLTPKLQGPEITVKS